MSRRKKRGPPTSPAARTDGSERSNASADAKNSPTERRIPPPRPPRKNLPLLLTCAALVAIWLVMLILLAATK